MYWGIKIKRCPKMKFPPVLQLIGFSVLAWLLAAKMPFGEIASPPLITMIFAGLGLLFLTPAIFQFRVRKTTVNPITPSNASTLVTNGFFKLTRNPMYVGLALLLLSFCLFLGRYSALLMVPVFIASITQFQIKAEERALSEKFGDAFDRYAKRVPRWLIV